MRDIIATLASAEADIARKIAATQGAIRHALAEGVSTAALRAELAQLERSAADNANRRTALLASLRAEAEASQRAALADAGAVIARASAERLKLLIAELTPPRPPRAVRGRP